MNRAPHPVTLRQLQYLAAIADLRSFRRAAEACHVSQPSLSAQVAEAERALGVRLFERDRRGVLVTRAGEALLDRIRRVLVEADDLVEAARRHADPRAGTLRLGILPTIGPYLLPAAVPALRAALPRLAVRWDEDRTAALVRKVEAGELDGAVLAAEADLDGLETAVLGEDPFLVAVPPDHPLARGEAPVRSAELRGTDVLLLDDGHCLRAQALDVCAAARARELDFRATSLSTLVQMVAGGAGLTLLPALAAGTEAPRSGLVLRPFAPPAPARTLVLAWRRRSAAEPTLREVAEVVARAAREVVGARAHPETGARSRPGSAGPRATRRRAATRRP
ncbi:LysR substrate-binding domain-containing protein [Anaeromyxobacter oryzae]|uniref:LysR substrate-binding domain-containing protein n=1 Tax=Anaeromyxobacter oryzae TaxID=2918170 RepID=UPI0020BD706B|nr:LysR substrate-binding domain-containing protein [Anaeromyxobacter oryzae]